MKDSNAAPDTLVDFSKTPYREIFWERHYHTLKHFLESFLKCKASIVHSPIDRFKKLYGVDIGADPECPIYDPGGGVILMVAVAPGPKGELIFLGIVLKEPQLTLPPLRMVRSIARMLKRRFHKGVRRNFDVDLQNFGQDLILDVIVNYLSRGGFDRYHLRLIFELFISIRTLTFEDRPFNTGLILTPSHREYSAEKRAGFLVPMSDPVWVSPTTQFEKRFWYLGDGSSCFFVSDRKLQINSMFFLDPRRCAATSISSLLLRNSLHDRDLAFRTMAGKEMVAVAATGEEFTYTGTQWHFRDYRLIRNSFAKLLPEFSDQALNTLLELILSQMTQRFGSLIWFPDNEESVSRHTVQSTRLWQHDIGIEPRYVGLIQRLASSDGALIITKDAKISRFGAVANLSSAYAADSELSGSGSIAARFLSQYGIVVKISQDGTGRVYVNGTMRWVI